MSSTNPTLSPSLHVAIPAVSTFALLSLLSTASLLGFISYRMFTWRRYYNTPIFRNQYVILIFNLCMADLLQALALTISWHWLQMGEIRSNSNWCFGQGLLIQIGDVSSAFFVLAIALHTWFRVVKSKDMRYNIFIGAVAFIWLAAILLTIIAPIMNGRQVYAPLGYWCFIGAKYESDRLALHYIWIFIVEFSSFLIYIWIFYHLHSYQRRNGLLGFGQTHAKAKKLVWASRAMLAYPVVYTLLTIPLASIRMAAYAGHTIPAVYLLVAGCFMVSCGWVNALIYTLTRRILLKREVSTNNGTFQTIGNESSKGDAKKGSRIRSDIDMLDATISDQTLPNDKLPTKLADGVTIACSSGAHDVDCTAFDESASNISQGPLIHMHAMPPVYENSQNPPPTAQHDHSPRHHSPFSLSRMYFNSAGRDSQRRDRRHGSSPDLSSGGIVVTNDIHVDCTCDGEVRTHTGDETGS